MKSKESLLYVVIVLLGILIGFQQCVISKNGKIPISDPKNVQAHIIPIDSASFYTKNFRDGVAELKKELRDTSFLAESFSLPDAELFNRDAISSLLNATGAEGIRIYLGRDSMGLIRLVLVPADGNGNDIITQLMPSPRLLMVPGINAAYAEPPHTFGQAIENGQRCPTICGKNSPLN